MQSGSADVAPDVFDGWGYMLKIVDKNEEATVVIQRNV